MATRPFFKGLQHTSLPADFCPSKPQEDEMIKRRADCILYQSARFFCGEEEIDTARTERPSGEEAAKAADEEDPVLTSL